MKNIIISLRQWFLLAILVIVFLLFYYFDLYHYLNLETLKSYQASSVQWTNDHYHIAVTIYLLLFMGLIACGIPCATLFTLLGGFLFGISAFIYAALGITGGGMILFLAVRTSIGKKIAAKSSGWIKTMEYGFQQNAFHYLLMLRLVPVFPCGVSNIAAGALNVPLKTFIAATMLGIAPSTLIYVLVGRGLDRVVNSDISSLNLFTSPSLLTPLIGLTALSFFPIIYKSVKKTNQAR